MSDAEGRARQRQAPVGSGGELERRRRLTTEAVGAVSEDGAGGDLGVFGQQSEWHRTDGGPGLQDVTVDDHLQKEVTAGKDGVIKGLDAAKVVHEVTADDDDGGGILAPQFGAAGARCEELKRGRDSAAEEAGIVFDAGGVADDVGHSVGGTGNKQAEGGGEDGELHGELLDRWG